MPSEKLGVARSGRRVCARGAMPTKKKGGADCQFVVKGKLAMNPEQMTNLHALHNARYKGEEDINCHSCLQAQEAIIKGATGLVVATEGHDKSPATCLQAFWRVCCQSGKMNKNGTLGRKAMKLTVEDIRAGEQALSRASTAPGTPSYNMEDDEDDEDEDEEVPDTKEGGSSSPAKTAKQLASAAPRKAAPTVDPKAAIEVEDADEMLVDEDAADMLVDEEPKKKRGRGRPKGSKN